MGDTQLIARFGVRDTEGRSSGVYRLFCDAALGDVYLVNRAWKGGTKISLHPSGACHFKRRIATAPRPDDEVFLKDGLGDTEPYLSKWTCPRPPREAVPAVKVIIFPTELIRAPAPPAKKDVFWVPSPADDTYVAFVVWLTTVARSPDYIDWKAVNQQLIAWRPLKADSVILTFGTSQIQEQHIVGLAQSKSEDRTRMAGIKPPPGVYRSLLWFRTLQSDGAQVFVESALGTP